MFSEKVPGNASFLSAGDCMFKKTIQYWKKRRKERGREGKKEGRFLANYFWQTEMKASCYSMISSCIKEQKGVRIFAEFFFFLTENYLQMGYLWFSLKSIDCVLCEHLKGRILLWVDTGLIRGWMSPERWLPKQLRLSNFTSEVKCMLQILSFLWPTHYLRFLTSHYLKFWVWIGEI